MMQDDHDHEVEDGGGGNNNLKQMLIFGGVVVTIGVLFFGAIVTAIVLKGNDGEKQSRYATTRPAMYYPMATVATAPRFETTVPTTAFNDVNTPDGVPVVTSKPPLVVPGTDFEYQITTRSKVGVGEYILGGPPGMTVSKTGLVTWRVKADYNGKESVTINVVDKIGRFTYHTFKLEIR